MNPSTTPLLVPVIAQSIISLRAHSIGLVFWALVIALFAIRVEAQTILVNPGVNGDLLSLGERPPNVGVADEYFAQSFSTPAADSTVQQIGFYIVNETGSPSFGVNTAGPVKIRLLLTSVVFDSTGIRPNQVLFESAPFSIPYTGPGPSPFTFEQISVPNVPLQPSTVYAFVLDTASDENLQDNVAARAALQLGQGYNGGTFFSYRVPWEQTGGVIGPRSAHFAADWSEFPSVSNTDMAFQINFVPEPSSATLTLIGFAGLLLTVGTLSNGRNSRRTSAV